MKKFAAALAFAAALSAGAAFAGPMDNTFGNTVVVTYASGAQARYHFNADGTFTGVAPGGSTIRGNWTAADGQLCLHPPTGGAHAPTCTPLADEAKNVGDTWTQTGSDGSQISVTLEAGHGHAGH